MFRNVEERKLMRAYKKYVKETGCDVTAFKNDIYLQELDVHRKNDESAERDEDRKALTCSFEDINTKKYPNATSPSAEAVYFGEFFDEETKKLKAIIATLTETQRERIYMHICHDMSFKEIAERDGVSSESVRESFWKGIKKLRRYSDFIQNISLKKWIHLFK